MRLYEPTLLGICFFLLGVPLNSTAAMINCNPNNAMANGFNADACIGDSKIRPPQEKAFVNDNLQESGDAFSFIGKFDADEGFEPGGAELAGFSLSVSKLSDPNTGDYFFSYALLAPDDWLEKIVDLTLLIKQANNSTIAYLFSGTTIGIDIGFNNPWANPRGKIVNDFSHLSGFIRLAENDISTLAKDDLSTTSSIMTTTVPEPNLTLLFSIGLLGLATRSLINRKRRFGM